MPSEIYCNTKRITQDAYDLELLSASFFATGNPIVGKKLYAIAQSLIESCENINEASNSESYDRFRTAQKSSANVLRALIGGIEIGKKEERDSVK